MEANERKVSTRVQGAAWRRRDAPKARGVSFPERHGGLVEIRREMRKRRKVEEERHVRGMPVEEEDERVLMKGLGKPEAYFFQV